MGFHVKFPAEDPPADHAIMAFLLAMHLTDVLRQITLLSKGNLAAGKAADIGLEA